MRKEQSKSQTTTTATTLSAGRVGGDGSDVLDAADAHAGTGKGTESGLGTRAGGLGAGTTGSTELDVKGGDTDLLAADGAVLSGQHGSVGRRLVTVSLDLHATYLVGNENGEGVRVSKWVVGGVVGAKAGARNTSIRKTAMTGVLRSCCMLLQLRTPKVCSNAKARRRRSSLGN